MSAGDEKLLGIEIGGTKLQVVLGTPNGQIVRRWRGTTSPELGGPGIRGQLRTAVRDVLDGIRPSAAGAGFGGPVDWRTGRVCKSHQIEGWEGFELSGFLSGLTHSPSFVDNDANVAALGEATLGAGRGADPVFYVTLGSGVGGGFVAGGQIYHGVPPGEAEFGHLWLDRNGNNVESRCSGWAIDRRIRAAIEANPNTPMARFVGQDRKAEARHLAAALKLNDPTARAILQELAEDLGFALSHVVHLLNPSLIILGGGLSLTGEPLRAAVTGALGHRIMRALTPGPAVLLAELREDAVPVGALILASRRLAAVNQ